MKNSGLFILLAFFAIVFMGCPYSSEVPIDEPSVKTDPKLIGKWEDKNSSEYNYIISKSGDFNYKICKRKIKAESTGTDTSTYMAYVSDVNGTRFLNLWEAYSTSKSYSLYKLELNGSGSKLTLASVTENIDEKFTSSPELKKFIQMYMNLSFFYSKDEDVYIRED
jgi:hypothetical protein